MIKCMCVTEHPQVTGDLPTEESALAVWTEVKTRPAHWRAQADAEAWGGRGPSASYEE
jgi:hypothetical protein